MKLRRARMFSVYLVLVTVLSIGCATRERRNSLSDQQLEQRVKSVLNAQPVYKYPDVQVRTSQGVVELTGVVSSDSQKSLATEIVRNIRGVSGLTNRISVDVPDRQRVREPLNLPQD